MKFRVHPLEPMHAFGPVEVNEEVLIARLTLPPDSTPELQLLSTSYKETFRALLADDKLGTDPEAWRRSLESKCLTLVEEGG
mgnify:CR=1 FL=1